MTQPLAQPSDLVLTDVSEIAFASAWIRAYCGWHIYPSQTDTIVLDTFGGQLVLLPTLHMTALGPVVLTDGPTTVDAATLSWSETGAVSYRPTPGVFPTVVPCWPVGLRAASFTITHGYPAVPDAVKAVAVAVSKRMPFGFANVTQEQAGLVQRSYGGSMFTAGEQAALNRYRIWP